LVKDAVVIADSAREFANQTLNLMSDEDRRKRYATLALEVARNHFSQEACYREILTFIAEHSRSKMVASGWSRRAARPTGLKDSVRDAIGRRS